MNPKLQMIIEYIFKYIREILIFGTLGVLLFWALLGIAQKAGEKNASITAEEEYIAKENYFTRKTREMVLEKLKVSTSGIPYVESCINHKVYITFNPFNESSNTISTQETCDE